MSKALPEGSVMLTGDAAATYERMRLAAIDLASATSAVKLAQKRYQEAFAAHMTSVTGQPVIP